MNLRFFEGTIRKLKYEIGSISHEILYITFICALIITIKASELFNKHCVLVGTPFMSRNVGRPHSLHILLT